MKLLPTDKHTRTMLATELSDFPDGLEITIGYTGQGNAHKGAALDGEVVPAIMNAVNAEKLTTYRIQHRKLGVWDNYCAKDGTPMEFLFRNHAESLVEWLAGDMANWRLVDSHGNYHQVQS